jgi:hypothetical protein
MGEAKEYLTEIFFPSLAACPAAVRLLTSHLACPQHQPALLFSQNKSTNSTFLSVQISTSHQPNEKISFV